MVGIEAQLIDIRDLLDVHKRIDVAPAFADLDDDVGAASENAGTVALVVQKGRRVGDGFRGGVGDVFHEDSRDLLRLAFAGFGVL